MDRHESMLHRGHDAHSACVAPGIAPSNGQESLDDSELRQSLERFWALTFDYMAIVPDHLVTWRVPFIYDERAMGSTSKYKPFFEIMRHMFEVSPEGCVRSKAMGLKAHDLTPSIWVRGVIVFLFFEFVFDSGSLFDDASILQRCLLDSKSREIQTLIQRIFLMDNAGGLSLQSAEMIIQDFRIRTLREKPKIFLDHTTTLRKERLDRLTAIMLPIVGHNQKIASFHQQIVNIATDLNEKISAYPGKFEAIHPKIGDTFDPKLHTLDNPKLESQELVSQPILMNTMFGIKFKLPNNDWRICSPATVQLWMNEPRLPASTPGIARQPSSPIRPRSPAALSADLHLAVGSGPPSGVSIGTNPNMNDPVISTLATENRVVDVFPDENQWENLSTYLDHLTETYISADVFRIKVPEIPEVHTRNKGRFSRHISASAIRHNVRVERNGIFQLTQRSAEVNFPVQLIQAGSCESLEADEWVARFEEEVYDGTRLQEAYITKLDATEGKDQLRHHLGKKSPISSLNCAVLDNASRRVPGIHETQVFVSQGFGAVFQLQKEYFGLLSLNHNVYGTPKVWITIPSKEQSKLEHAIRQAVGLSEEDSKLCEQFVRNLDVYVPRGFLHRHGIEYSQFLQLAGQVVFTKSGVYRQGISCGFTIAETRNYAGKGWSPESLGPQCWGTKHSCCSILTDQELISLGHMLLNVDSKKRKSQSLRSQKRHRLGRKQEANRSKCYSNLVLESELLKGVLLDPNTSLLLPLAEPLFYIPNESQGLPCLDIKPFQGRQDWNKLEKFQQCAERGFAVGQSIGLHVTDGPPRGKILQIRRPEGSEDMQVLVALIWERSRIKEDAGGLKHLYERFIKDLDEVWPETDDSFKFMISTEFRVLACSSIRDESDPLSKNIEDSLCRSFVYHRPYNVEDTKIFRISEMEKFFTKGAPFWQISFTKR